jgi:putative transposase
MENLLQIVGEFVSLIYMREEGRITKTCKRYNISGQAHGLTFSCFHNQKFLSRPRTCQWLVMSILRAKEKHNFSLWAYVFMPDHVHLLIFPRNKEYSISKILQSIKQPVSSKAIAYLKENAPSALKKLSTGQKSRPYRFWQKGGGYDRNMTKVDTLIDSLRYIHLNPVRKKLVESPNGWYYSSAAQWDGLDAGPLPIDKSDWPAFI